LRAALPLVGAAALLLALGCGSASAPDGDFENAKRAPGEDGLGARGGGSPVVAAAPPAEAEIADDKPADMKLAAPEKAEADGRSMNGDKAPEGKKGNDEGGERVRKWFPEAFLWQPMVETDAAGQASIDVKVPDQLTSWRVLALAHTRDGRQAGALASFDSRLPIYVDPVVPGWLHAGDRLVLPVQVANATDAPLSTTLTVQASGALSGNGGGTVTLEGGASLVRSVSLVADGAGAAKVSAVLSGADAVIREIPVTPSGRPVSTVRGGVVSGEREFPIPSVERSDPTTQRLSVLVFPGPLAVLQSELERGGDAASPASAAYGFAVTSAWRSLAARVGAEVDEKALRRKQIVAWQRVVPWGRSPDGGAAADLLLGLRDAEGDELATSMRDRLVQTLVASQNGDGSWTRQAQGTVQEMIVQTALAVHALPASAEGPRFRARGAILRNLPVVKDGFTAAVVLSSGLVEGDARKPLEDLVIAAVPDGAGGRDVAIPASVVDAWGNPPSSAEMAAFCALALAGRADLPWRGDLVARLMSGYDADAGFGAGGADPIALEAVLSQLPGVDKPVDVALLVDGVEVSRGKLDPSQPKVPAVLGAMPHGGGHTAKIVVSPQVPGLAWVATSEDWVAWDGTERSPGVDLEIATQPLKVGRESTLTLTVDAPSGLPIEIVQGLPAGTVVDPASLAAMSDRVTSFQIHPDRVEMVLRSFAPGEVMTLPIGVQPAFAGRFTTVPMSIGPVIGRKSEMAPMVWNVAP
jgi:hypothetical protein